MSHHGPHLPLFRRGRPRLQRQLFTWLLVTIGMTGLAVGAVFHLNRVGDHRYAVEVERVESFVVERFADAWHDDVRRRELTRSLARAIPARVRVTDARGEILVRAGGDCDAPDRSVEIRDGATLLGRVDACFVWRPSNRGTGILALLTAGLVLWAAAAFLARRLTWPLSSLIAATREIGSGNLKSRVRLRRSQRSELGLLAEAINDMAERIERQLSEQRELLAAVSHEVRSPLARLRVSAELLRENAGDERALLAIEREVSEIDAVVGKLLASSRLDFGSLSKTAIDPREVVTRALERQGLPLELFEDLTSGQKTNLDPTLVARALDNLLENAKLHGQGPTRVRLRPAREGEHTTPPSAITFEVEDGGAGFAPEALIRAFDAFYRAPREGAETSPSLGLGLSLVRRIARAHGGSAWAKNLHQGGALVGFSVG